MRSIFAAFLTIAVILTGALVALDLALVLGISPIVEGPRRENPAASDDASLVHSFYKAANDLLSGEGESNLITFVTPHLRVHSGAGGTSDGFSTLTSHFTTLRRQGDVRLQVVQVIGEDRDFTALVEAHATTQNSSPESSERHPPLWLTIDRFRVQDGMIDEYWPGAIESRPLPALPHVALSEIPSGAVLSLSRLELGPEVTLRALAIPAPQLLFVESGVVTLAAPGTASVSRAGDARLDVRPPSSNADDILLGPGDAVLIQPGSGQGLVNPGDEPVALLSMLIAPRDALYGSRHHHSLDMLVAAGMHDPARLSRRTIWATEVVSETLAIGSLHEATSPLNAVHLTGRQLVIEPGESAIRSESSQLTFVIVSSGLMSAGPATAPGTRLATPPPGAPEFRLLRSGDALAVLAEDPVFLKNAGATRLDLAIIEVAVETPRQPGAPVCVPSDQTAPDC